MLFVDTREPLDVRTPIILACGSEHHTKALACADYVLFDRDGCSLGIERKTISDLIGSVEDGRLWGQLERMREYYTLPALLIEGALKLGKGGEVVLKRRTRFRHSSLQGVLWSVQSTGVRLLYSGGLPETADLIRTLHARARTKCLSIGGGNQHGPG